MTPKFTFENPEELVLYYHERLYVKIAMKFADGKEMPASMFFTHGRVFLFQNEHEGSSSSRFYGKDGYEYSWRIDGGHNYYCGEKVDPSIFEYTNNTNTGMWKCEVAEVTIFKRPLPENLISERYSKNSIYSGRNEYHTSHDCDWVMNTPLNPDDAASDVKMGCEIETIANEEDFDVLDSMESNIMFAEEDGSLGDEGFEWITVPLAISDATNPDFWKPYMNTLSKYSDVDEDCGFHIHISKSVFPEDKRTELIGKLIIFYQYVIKRTELNIHVNGRRYGYSECNPRSEIADALFNKTNKLVGPLEKSDIEEMVSQIIDDSTCERYCNINITNSKTIEFRLPAGSIDSNTISNYCRYYYLMVHYIIDTPWEKCMSKDEFVNYLLSNSEDNQNFKDLINRYK